ncbi:MAG: EAL domain-containing protein [Nitrospirae bacterium]|nr:EAL domain-containing protein [Nitrospirota bacterium]
MLTAFGFYYYYRADEGRLTRLKVDKYFILTGISFAIYGVLGGIVVPKGYIFPSNIINTDSFLAFVNIPVQVFRAATAIAATISIVGVIELFNLEARKKLEDTVHELYNRDEKITHDTQLQEAINSILNISLLPLSHDEQLKQILDLVMSISWISLQSKGCIFLCEDNSETLDIKAYHNLSEEQLKMCSHVPFGTCLCGLAARTKEIVFAANIENEYHTIRYRGMQPHGHYCIPIITGDRLVGVINVYLNDEHKRNDEEENFLRSIANTIAGIVLRKEQEEELKHNFLIQNVVNQILQVSLEMISLKEQLQKTLDIISDVSWLSTKSTGCIFLIEEDPEMLVMKAHKGVSLELFKTCAQLPMGKCLCGRAAATGDIIFKSGLDDTHEIRFEGMSNHGHYCIPIKSREKVLGVINLYVKAGHLQTKLEDNFLSSVANTLAGIIERKLMENKLEYMANHDILTGLPNRLLFYDRLKHEIKNARRYGSIFAILYFDVDSFKNINDTVGHDIGDLVLKGISSRLIKCIREADTVARVSSDEFTIILSNLKSAKDAEIIAEKILSAISEPFETTRINIKITASIGISFYPADATNAIDLLKRADIAMYYSKKAGRNEYTCFSLDMDALVSERMKLEGELRLALERNELVLHYQPQIDINTGRIIGAEALVRWQHPELGLIPPNRFIPLAEDTGLIIPLGEVVLKKSCEQNVIWQNMGFPSLTIAVNLSLKQISRQYNLIDLVFQVMYETQIDPNNLELELTESFCMQNVDSTISMLRKFNSMGIQVTIDDFGTGYSSLSYLKHLPFKKLKIDRSFVKEITKNQDDLTIVKTIIDMAHNLRLRVIAEGVEDPDQLEILRTLGCDEIQGFLFSKPIPQDEFIKILKEEEYFCKIGLKT